MTITSQHLVIDRNMVAALTAGRQQSIGLGDIVGYHVQEPGRLTNGSIQLSVGALRPALSGNAAAGDPHSMLFTRNQSEQMRALAEYLHRLVTHNRQHRARASEQPRALAPVRQIGSGPSFVGFDVETANRARGSICAIGLTVVENGTATATHSWLCQPPAGLDGFEARNTGVHGITARDVIAQPTFRSRLGDMLSVVGDLPLIAHNASFDIGALREASAAEYQSWRPLAYDCTLRWSRRDLPELPNHKLPTVAGALGVDLRQHHDAAADATAAAEVALRLMQRQGAVSVNDYLAKHRSALGSATVDASTPPRDARPRAARAAAAPAAQARAPRALTGADPSHSLFGHTVVLTGAVGNMGRDELWARIAERGATPAKSVTKTTSVLVVGSWLDADGQPITTGKLAKARGLIEAGQPLAILDAAQFAAVLAGDRQIPLPKLRTAPIDTAMTLANPRRVSAEDRENPRKMVRSKHIDAWVPVIDQLKRDGNLEEALTLLLECVIVAERAENCVGGEPEPEWTLQAGIVYRKQRDHRGEVSVLQRWIRQARRNGLTASPTHPVVVRLTKAEELLGR
ncbi:exonuclease domain-containing protein [Tomitella biformata]|uniref:exonuclease domain-containing protein n=1 Tax=Tomitella biformata TaxID=630403 RepID=UPI0004AE935B|nr:exonuclease domain-containing protein [Tomitella biformata]